MSALRRGLNGEMAPARPTRRSVRPAVTGNGSHPGSVAGRMQGRGVLITGAASGIGRALALAFAREGARVSMLDRDEKNGQATLKAVREVNPAAKFICGDLRRDTDVRTLAATVFSGAGGADILINNAADMGRIVPFVDLKRADYERVFRSNVAGPFLLSQLAARSMIAAGRKGTIINVHAIQTSLPVPGYSAYVTSKGAIDAMTLALAVDLAAHGIRVNGVEVGCVSTESFQFAMRERLKGNGANLDGAELERLLDRRAATLLGRMGRPDEIAKVALFLASDESSFLTGSVIRADGGRAISRKTEPLL